MLATLNVFHHSVCSYNLSDTFLINGRIKQTTTVCLCRPSLWIPQVFRMFLYIAATNNFATKPILCLFTTLSCVFFFFLQWNNQLPRFTVAPRFFTPSSKGTTFRSADQPELTTCHWLPPTFKTECDRLAQLGGKTRTRFPYTRQHVPLFFSKNSDFKFQENVNKICTIYP